MKKDGKKHLNFYKAETLLHRKTKGYRKIGKTSQHKTKIPFLLPSKRRT